MGGKSKHAGCGGGGSRGSNSGRNCNPSERPAINKDLGVPGRDLHAAAEKMMQRIQNHKQQQGSSRPPRSSSSHGPTTEEREDHRASDLAAIALHAMQRSTQYNAQLQLQGNPNDGDYQGASSKEMSMRRFSSVFRNVVDKSDVILEVLDARDPLGCQLRECEHCVESQFGDKKTILLVLNKTDLVPAEIVDAWMTFFEQEQHKLALPFTSRHAPNAGAAQATSSASAHRKGGVSNLQSSEACIGRMFRSLRKIARGGGDARKSITVGVIGYPNVGKSSIINALRRREVVGVGNTPGFTTGQTEVDLRSDIKVIDCPGVVMPGEDVGDVILRNAVKLTSVTDPLAAVSRLVERCNREQLARMFDVAPFADADEFVKAVARRRGCIRQGGVADENEACLLVLKAWNDGNIGYYTLPPTRVGIPTNAPL